MKMMKRILALSLALILAVSLMPNVLQVKASTDAEATAPVVVWEDSFEVGEGGTFTENSVQNTATTTDGLPNWNGAEANTANYWKADMQAGSVIISGGVGSDEGVAPKHGNSCISLSNAPDSTNAKNIVYFNYNLNNVINTNNLQLKDNQMYVLSVWVKYAADTSYTTKIMVKGMQTFTLADGKTTSTANPYDTNNTNKTTEWTKVEVPFMYNSSKTNILVDLEMQGNTATGTVYFDLLQITEMVDATGIVLDSTAATLATADTLQLTPGFEPATATTKVTYTWSSDNKAVATVDSTGKVTAVSEGEATITATAQVYEYNFDNNVRKWQAKTGEGATLTATCTVTVRDMFSIDSACINLGEDLDMKFFINPDDLPEGPEGFTATIRRTYADDREDDVKENVALSTYSDGWYYVSYSGIVAKEMGDKIYVTIYDSEGNAVSKEWEDSVAKLAYRAIEDCTESEAAEELNAFVALLNYGAAAQNTFDYDKTNLVNADLSDGQKTVAAYTGTDASAGGASAELRLNESIMLKSFFATDVLEGATSVKVSFTNYRNQPAEYTVTAFGEDAADNGAYKYVPVTGLVIADVDTVVTITIENAERTITVQDSMASYVARAKEAGDNDPLYDAIMALGAAAKTYLLNK